MRVYSNLYITFTRRERTRCILNLAVLVLGEEVRALLDRRIRKDTFEFCESDFFQSFPFIERLGRTELDALLRRAFLRKVGRVSSVTRDIFIRRKLRTRNVVHFHVARAREEVRLVRTFRDGCYSVDGDEPSLGQRLPRRSNRVRAILDRNDPSWWRGDTVRFINGGRTGQIYSCQS